MNTPDADLLITYLATHDAPCPGCGYNLKGISAKACPECGEEIELFELTRRSPRASVPSIGTILYAANICGMLLLAPVCWPALQRYIVGDYPTSSVSSYGYFEVVVPTTVAMMTGPYLLLVYLLITRTHKPMTTHWGIWLVFNPISIGGAIYCAGFAASLVAAALIWN